MFGPKLNQTWSCPLKAMSIDDIAKATERKRDREESKRHIKFVASCNTHSSGRKERKPPEKFIFYYAKHDGL